ncbi:pyridoxal phosphatase [Orbaceae bacterium ac157xtp]
MTYKAVAFDMDGTLLNGQRAILPETLNVIKQLKAKGIKIILVTGRHHSIVYPYYHQLQLDTPVICCNGTYLYDFEQKRYFDANPMSKERAKTLLQLVEKHQIHTMIYTNDAMNYEVLDDHITSLSAWLNTIPANIRPQIHKTESFKQTIENAEVIFKFAASSHDLDALRRFSDEVESLGDFECEWSWVNRADIAKKGNTKGNGLANWAKNQHIPVEQIVAFGDSYNDLSMLTLAGLGIAMGNADDEIKALADEVIGDNNQPSIAGKLRELFF